MLAKKQQALEQAQKQAKEAEARFREFSDQADKHAAKGAQAAEAAHQHAAKYKQLQEQAQLHSSKHEKLWKEAIGCAPPATLCANSRPSQSCCGQAPQFPSATLLDLVTVGSSCTVCFFLHWWQQSVMRQSLAGLSLQGSGCAWGCLVVLTLCAPHSVGMLGSTLRGCVAAGTAQRAAIRRLTS